MVFVGDLKLMCRVERLLEGECFQHDGKIWCVKGYQHPEGFVVAYPKYDLFSSSKVRSFEKIYWDCIKHEVSVVPLNSVKPYMYALESSVRESVLRLFITCSGLSEERVLITGSSIIGSDYGDLDIVVFGLDERDAEDIHSSLIRCFKPINENILVRDYYDKHQFDTDLFTYLLLKRDTRLHYMYGNLHVNLRYVYYDRGWGYCVEPVSSYSNFKGVVEVLYPIRRYTIPSLYVVKYNGNELYLWSLREAYAEMPKGLYYVEGRLEERRDGLYIVPDNGWLSKI